jgi:hypothetical protein
VAEPQTFVSSPLEVAAVRSLPWLVGGLLVSVLLLLVPDDLDLTRLFLVHLSALTMLGVIVSARVAPLLGGDWYAGYTMSDTWRRIAGGASLVVVVTGLVGLVTLASSAALRFAPSVQFLQMLSALDIAWVVAATLIGATRLWGRAIGTGAGAVMGAFCVASIVNYLRVVGFSPVGEWVLDGGELMRLVIPSDMLAATVAIVILVAAARRA